MKTKKKKGFTLTELIVVIVIIGVLAAVLIPSLTGYITKAQNAKDETLVISLNKELNLRKIEDDDLEFYTAYDVQTYLKSVGMENIEVANKNSIILFDAEDYEFVLVKEDEIDELLEQNEFVYHISEYYSIKVKKVEDVSSTGSGATILPLGYKKLDNSVDYETHRAFVISINGNDIAKAVKAVMDLPTTSNTDEVKKTLNSLSDSTITTLAYDSIVKTLYINNDSYYYYDNDLVKKTYTNDAYEISNKQQQKITRVIILPEVEKLNLDKISNLQKSTVLIPGSCLDVEGSLENEVLKIDFIGNTDLLDGTSIKINETNYNEAYKRLDIKEITYINSFVKTETELYELIDIYKNFDKYTDQIHVLYPDENLDNEKEIIIIQNITVNQDIDIPVGVSLIIPYDETYATVGSDETIRKNTFVKVHRKNSEGEYDFDSYRNGFFKELTIASGKKVNVFGKITVGGVTGSTATELVGHTTSSYGQLTLLSGSELYIEPTGTLDVYGYVIGQGKIYTEYDELTQKGSVINEPFIIGDYFGGKQSAMLAGKFGYTINSNGQCSPFSQYGLNNIQVDIKIVKGASLNGHVKIYMDDKYQTNNGVPLPLISSESGSFIKINKGYISLSYSTEDILDYTSTSFANIGKTMVDVYGDVETGKIDINVSAASMTFSLSSSDFLLPIPFNFNINFMSGSSIIKTDIALLPGCEMVVNSGANLQIASDASLFIIDKLVENSGNNTAFSYQGLYYPCNEQSNLIVNGTLIIKGTFGGVIQTKQKDAKVITTPKAVLDGNNQAKFGCGTKEFITSSLSFAEASTLNNYELKAYIANSDSLILMETGKEYTSTYDENSSSYTGTTSDTIKCWVANNNETEDYKQKFLFFNFTAGTKWKLIEKSIDRNNLTYYGKWTEKPAEFYTVKITSVDSSGSKLTLKVGLDNEYALNTGTDTIYMTLGVIDYTYFCYLDEKITGYYEFVGLYKDKNCSQQWNFENDYVEKDNIELYAKWERRYLVTFYDEDGKTVLNTAYVAKNETVSSFTPTKSGYTFSGWYTKKSGGSKVEPTDKKITDDTNYYAGWTENK